MKKEKTSGRLAWSMFGVDGGEPLDDIQTEDNHYLGYPYDSIVYQSTNFSVISETHFGYRVFNLMKRRLHAMFASPKLFYDNF